MNGHNKKWEHKVEMAIHINDTCCWMCGEKAQEHHHALFKRYNPRKNVHIPVCIVCHDILHPERIRTKSTQEVKMKAKELTVVTEVVTDEQRATKVIQSIHKTIYERKQELVEAEKKLVEVLEKDISDIKEVDGNHWDW